MYLTAQRVRSPEGLREGINVFLFSLDPTSAVDWNGPDIDAIAASPGRLVLEVIAVPPGMNSVNSYLDAVAPEGTTSAALATQVERLATRFEEAAPASTWGEGSVWLRFYANPASHPDAASEFRRLKDRLLLTLGTVATPGAPRAGTLPAPRPLRILSTEDESGVRYVLEDQSRRMLRTVRPDLRLPLSLGVTHENRADLLGIYGGHAYQDFAVALTGLALDQLEALAGVEILAPDGCVLWSSLQPG